VRVKAVIVTRQCVPRYSAASAIFGSQMVVSGGQDKVNVLCTVEALDPERGWINLSDLPRSRKYHSMQSVRRYSYNMTAACMAPGCATISVLCNVYQCSYVEAVCRRLYCFGGKSVDSRRHTVVEALDPREGKWSVVAHMQEPRSSFGAAFQR
jgi:Kelch motif